MEETAVVHQPLPPTIHASWHEHLQPLFDDKKMLMIRDEILPQGKFYPEGKDIFNVFKMPLDQIKVVILGQDPYPNGEAIGYAFAVGEYTPKPGSLEVLCKEIVKSDAPTDPNTSILLKGWKPLIHWRQQGVFLLNAALTVAAGEPNSHAGYWRWFTAAVVKIISENTVGTVWLLWGSQAKAYKEYIQPKIDDINTLDKIMAILPLEEKKSFHFVFEANHPAAELHPDSKYKFTGCNHFIFCNIGLKLQNKKPILW